jgi:hypothetical protein
MRRWTTSVRWFGRLLILAAVAVVVQRSYVLSALIIQELRLRSYESGGRDIKWPDLLADVPYKVLQEKRIPPKRLVLLIVVAPECPSCDQAWSDWSALSPPGQMATAEVWRLTVGRSHSHGPIAGAGGFRDLEIATDRHRFGALTGVYGIPTSMLLKSDGRVMCTIQGRLISSQLKECWTAIEQDRGSRALFFRNEGFVSLPN